MAYASVILTPTFKLSSSTGINPSGLCSPKFATERVRCSGTSPKSAAPRLVSKGCKLVGCGSAVPKQKFSNDDLAKIVDTNDEWISSRTGILNRHILTGTENLTSLAVEAAQKALEMAEVNADDVDLILFCSSTPDELFGGAPEVQKTLGCKRNPPAFDIRAACSGFLLGLVSASCHIRGGGFKNVLVIGADCVTRYLDWTDKKTCVLFGDAAGAVLLQACDSEEDGLYGFDLHTDGFGNKHLNAGMKHIETNLASGCDGDSLGFSPTHASFSYIQMNGQEVFRFVVKVVPESIKASLAKASFRLSDIDWLLVHQANQRIIDHLATKLEFPMDRVISNVKNYGNTSAASIPLALDEAVRSGKVKEGQTIVTAGFGAGLSWGSAVVRWG
ncbi:putative beta-ketoacyl-[acyl-carrier-protein] synthase III [Helianthus annuus]|uniref:beta-ketoacyl-[acyl-carrier-protein] synthase III n=1 Tax=Helianthus annuus TaxID=4232 RepID=A0A251RQ21_HELAN|nr:3-oxoacyl-[acyl-carrier-protein] synthase III, chloroplastic isoform X1 [Helianthus annuus]KAF5755316.1 putative beta-ketoacyl-[acyl-carrier-protein] synthase III [Helianthus annuus]KAJ0429076.1 putative beta-ketoacyl-[acyl-carrier-protein] synthase III [Helianthus annuus]KAJ0447409.1 putative beta-ketoacyl-[acyl-carrier-protein] synthase III [Helianthus annuus]KAJ0632288.1 putative beta-ketoacyl-[acyl-carrier-protein] synthase III [Helianthus annuus]KAJ0636183.1 putative beta-ketoacyl-[acy